MIVTIGPGCTFTNQTARVNVHTWAVVSPAQGAIMQGKPNHKPLSEKPPAIRARIRRRSEPMTRDLDMLAETLKPLEEWDFEELAKGRPRNKNGNFIGAGPKWVTPAVKSEAKRRLKTKAMDRLGEHVEHAIAVLVDLMMCEDVDDNGKPLVDVKTRMAAATYILDQVIGKARQGVDISTDSGGFQAIIAGAMKVETIEGDYVDAHPVVDGAWEEAEAT